MSSANVKVDQLVYFSLRRRGLQTARFLECHLEQGSMSLDDRVFATAFPNHHGQDTSGLAPSLKVGTKFGALSRIKTSTADRSV